MATERERVGLPFDARELSRALQVAAHRRAALEESRQGRAPTTAYRLFHGIAEGAPWLAVDVYDRWLVAHLFEELGAAGEAELLDLLAGLGRTGVYLKRHPRQKNELVDPRDDRFAPPLPLRGEAAPQTLVVHEHGLPFGVRLGDGLRTGLFLDQRDNRRRVGDSAAGKNVLNLFAYTGGFSVAALAGSAARAVCVDSSSAALERARENVARIGGSERHRVLCDDAFAVLARMQRRGERHDVIVIDPPSYSTARSRRFRVRKDYVTLTRACLRVLAPGGSVLACINHHGCRQAELRRFVLEAAAAEGRRVARLQDAPAALDFPARAGDEPLAKAVSFVVEPGR